ncbi:MAG TPA: (2Fe-2S)-binding protein [Thermohalobaculum sp.]|nr:(2Fe-2S)-binding protein [Thermohalobaculum sp.]
MNAQIDPVRDEVVCVCFETTRGTIERHLADPKNNYDTLVETTGVGTKCTACLLDLDLVVHEATGQHADSRVVADARPVAQGHGIKMPFDQSNSGLLINRDGISTHIRVANFGPMFQSMPYSVRYRYRVLAVSEDGRVAARARGGFGFGEDVCIDLGALPGAPADGWFLFDLYPQREGFMGSIRPQIALVGPGWATTYHPQYQSVACRGRGIVLQGVDGRFATAVHLINADRRETTLEFRMSSLESDFKATFTRTLGRYASALQDLDQPFPDAPRNELLDVFVASDHPVRKHVVNRLSDGAMSVDHFPNFK